MSRSLLKAPGAAYAVPGVFACGQVPCHRTASMACYAIASVGQICRKPSTERLRLPLHPAARPSNASIMPTDFTPSRNEDEYFARVDADLRKALRAKADADRASRVAADRNRCPRDGTPLQAVEAQHVTIDKCPTCEGIWLDKGELELLAAGNAEHAGFVGSLLRLFK